MERKVDFFQPLKKQDDGRPLSIVFALDVSGSMTAPELERLRTAMQKFIDRLADYNSYFAVMSFAMDVRTLASFTNRPDRLEKSFSKLMRDQDGLSTHAYDAVDDAVRLLARKAPRALKDRLPKRAVVVITDGFPVGDTVTPQTVIERCERGGNDRLFGDPAVFFPTPTRPRPAPDAARSKRPHSKDRRQELLCNRQRLRTAFQGPRRGSDLVLRPCFLSEGRQCINFETSSDPHRIQTGLHRPPKPHELYAQIIDQIRSAIFCR